MRLDDFNVSSIKTAILQRCSSAARFVREVNTTCWTCFLCTCLTRLALQYIIIYFVQYTTDGHTPISIKVALGFGHWNIEYNAMLCLSDYQTMVFKDQSMIPEATFIEICVYVTVTAKGPGFYRRHHHGNSNITVQDRHLTTWPPSRSLPPGGKLKDLNLVPKMLPGPAIINQLNQITIITCISKIQLVVYYQCCILIGWATTRLYVIAH